ncbi:MAG: topoisomerase DNA-binding C4 zinc finger domain-containing protein [Ktedonobacteraceae bacterium]|nr:topoisomerase DNA-binding C4 zinc finger domain-containing protein [Ktedonobacteraceae bacterium]
MEETCPECGRNLVIRTGRFGRFISCSGFPECSYRRSVVNKTGAFCPLCHGDLVERKTRQKKRVFYGCGNYPTCNFAIWDKPVPDLCPKCGGLMVVTRPGQDPVCYQEVIAPQRSAEEKPLQDGEQKTTRKKAARTEGEASNGTAAKSTRRVSTRKKAGEDEVGLDGTTGGRTRKATGKTTARATAKRASATTTARTTRRASATTKKTSTTKKKSTGSRTKTV